MVGRKDADDATGSTEGNVFVPVRGRLTAWEQEASSGVVDGLLGAVLDPHPAEGIVVPDRDEAGLRAALSILFLKAKEVLAVALVTEGQEGDDDGQEGADSGEGFPVPAHGVRRQRGRAGAGAGDQGAPRKQGRLRRRTRWKRQSTTQERRNSSKTVWAPLETPTPRNYLINGCDVRE